MLTPVLRMSMPATSAPLIFHAPRCLRCHQLTIKARDDLQAHINASGDARRGDDMPLVDDTRICQHFYGRVPWASATHAVTTRTERLSFPPLDHRCVGEGMSSLASFPGHVKLLGG